MSKVSLKVEIAGKTYPLTVLETEKDKVASAAKSINEAVQLLQKNYAVTDHRDLLAMAALQLLLKMPDAQIETNPTDFLTIKNKLDDLENEVSQWL